MIQPPDRVAAAACLHKSPEPAETPQTESPRRRKAKARPMAQAMRESRWSCKTKGTAPLDWHPNFPNPSSWACACLCPSGRRTYRHLNKDSNGIHSFTGVGARPGRFLTSKRCLPHHQPTTNNYCRPTKMHCILCRRFKNSNLPQPVYFVLQMANKCRRPCQSPACSHLHV